MFAVIAKQVCKKALKVAKLLLLPCPQEAPSWGRVRQGRQEVILLVHSPSFGLFASSGAPLSSSVAPAGEGIPDKLVSNGNGHVPYPLSI